MKIKSFQIPAFIQKKFFWQSVLGFLFIVFIIFFIRNESVEIHTIKGLISNANVYYLLAGLLVTLIYILLQGWLYVYSFKSLGSHITLSSSVLLFLKRNVVGVLVPGGTFSSLAFFNKDLENQKINKTQQYLGSYIFGLASTVSIMVVAIPALILLALKGRLNGIEIAGFALLAIVVVGLGLGLYGLLRKKEGYVHRLIEKYKPDWLLIFREFSSQKISPKKLIYACLISIGIEVSGVLHLYIALLALNASAFFLVALTGYVTMVIVMTFSPFLKGIGAIELSLTYLLVQFGYDPSMAASVTILFRLFEFWLPLAAGLIVFIAKRENILLRLIPSILLLVLGFTNIISVLTPAIPSRLAFISDILPQGLINISNFGVLFFGVIFILLSVYLFMGSKNAWRIALILSVVSLLGHITKALDYEEAILSLSVFLSLIYTRRSYFLKHRLELKIKEFKHFLIILLSLIVIGILGFYLLDKTHFGKNFSLSEALTSFFNSLTGHEPYLPKTRFAHEFLFTIRFLFAAVLIYFLWLIIVPAKRRKLMEQAERIKATEIVEKYGDSRFDYFKVYSDKSFFFNEAGNGFVSFKTAENYSVALENPVGENYQVKQKLIKEFKKNNKKEGIGTFFYRIPETSREAYKKTGFKTVLIGQEAIVNLSEFSLSGSKKGALRNALNKINKSGFISKVYLPPIKDGLLQRLENVSNEWLIDQKMSEVAFTQGIFDREEVKKTAIITLENNEEEVLAFVNLIQDYTKSEGTYDLIRRAEGAPNGAVDFLVIQVFDYFKSAGFKSVNLGLSALSGFEKGNSLEKRALYFTVEYIKNKSRFKGLHDFKEKFDPVWENSYLAYETVYDLIRFPVILNKVSKI